MSNFNNLKKSKSSIDKLLAAVETTGGQQEKKSYGDDRFWKPTRDKSDNGYAVIRFLPAPEGEDLPWAKYWDHGFKGPTGKWYIENSLTSIGQPDPVGEMNSELWASGREEDKVIVRERKRRLHYVTNIMVIKDEANPQNEGKVFLYKFGQKIFDKIMEAMQPEFADDEPVNPFDFWEGAYFKLKIRKVAGWINYDKSEFSSASALSDDDDELEKIYNKLHSLKDFVDPKNYKSYDELKAKLNSVLGVSAGHVAMEAPSFAESAPAPEPVSTNDFGLSSEDSNEDDTLSYFAKLAAED